MLVKNSMLVKKKRRLDIEDDKCPICLDDVDAIKNVVTFECGHSLHFTCFAEYMASTKVLDQKCMLCRKEIYTEDIKNKMSKDRSEMVEVNVNNNNEDPMDFIFRMIGRPIPRAPRNDNELDLQRRVRRLGSLVLTDLELESRIREILLLSDHAYTLTEMYERLRGENIRITHNRTQTTMRRLQQRGILERTRQGNSSFRYFLLEV